ncbi:MAG: TA system VapC family ribonuclease toxin [Spirochaetota bacterium]
MPQHVAAKAWLDGRINDFAPVGLPWPSLLGFLRLTSNPRIFSQPLDLDAAWDIVKGWLACPKVWIPKETEDHAAILRHLLPFAAPGANLVPDLHLAALALGHGLIVCSTDADFARFKPVRWENPLG